MTDFETHRSHLRAVAYRMLGSAAEADDAVQEAWLRSQRAPADVANVRGWLTTVVARICLDMLRSRTSRREDPIDVRSPSDAPGAEGELSLAESVGLALMVVLDKLDPAERIAFVLHDVFALPFDEIADIVGRSPEATRQLASRARRRVQNATAPEIDVATQRRVVDRFIAALRSGDLEALVTVLNGNREWAQGATQFRRAMQHLKAVMIDGRIGVALAPGGKIGRVLVFDYAGEAILDADVVTEPEGLAELVIEELS